MLILRLFFSLHLHDETNRTTPYKKMTFFERFFLSLPKAAVQAVFRYQLRKRISTFFREKV